MGRGEKEEGVNDAGTIDRHGTRSADRNDTLERGWNGGGGRGTYCESTDIFLHPY